MVLSFRGRYSRDQTQVGRRDGKYLNLLGHSSYPAPSPLHIHTLSETRLLADPEHTYLAGLTVQQTQASSCLHLPGTRITDLHLHIQLFMWVLNSGPHACMAKHFTDPCNRNTSDSPDATSTETSVIVENAQGRTEGPVV